MKRNISLALAFLSVVVIGTAVVLLLPGRGKPSGKSVQNQVDNPTVAATIFPLYDIVKGVTGDSVKVIQIVPAGASPHTFEASPSLLTGLKGASVVFTVGHGLDGWVSQVAEAIGAQTLTLDKGIDLLRAHDTEEGGDGADPHYWLDPNNIKIMAETVTAELSRLWPDKAGLFQANLARYRMEIDAADAQAQALLAPIANRQLVTMHDAWYYFARHFGLEVVGSFEPTAGREPTPQYLADLSQAVKTAGVKVVYSEPLISTGALVPFLTDNGLKAVQLDPGEGSLSGRDTMVKIIIYDAQTISQNQ